MLRQVYIYRLYQKRELMYFRKFGKAVKKENFDAVLDDLEEEAFGRNPNEIATYDYFKYRISYISDKSLKLLFLFVTGLTDKEENIEEELKKCKKEFLNLFDDVIREGNYDKDTFEVFDPTVDGIHKNLRPKISLCGFSGVGKTTITKLIKAEEIPMKHIPTITGNIATIKIGKLHFYLWDFAGQEQFSYLWTNFIKGSDAVLLITDSTLENVEKSKFFLELINEQAPNAHSSVIANKQDLDDALPPEEIEDILGLKAYSMIAIDKDNRDKMIKIIADILEMDATVSPLLKPLLERDEKIAKAKKALNNNQFQKAAELFEEISDLCLELGDDSVSSEFYKKARLIRAKIQKAKEKAAKEKAKEGAKEEEVKGEKKVEDKEEKIPKVKELPEKPPEKEPSAKESGPVAKSSEPPQPPRTAADKVPEGGPESETIKAQETTPDTATTPPETASKKSFEPQIEKTSKAPHEIGSKTPQDTMSEQPTSEAETASEKAPKLTPEKPPGKPPEETAEIAKETRPEGLSSPPDTKPEKLQEKSKEKPAQPTKAEEENVKEKTIQYLQKAASVYDTISMDKIIARTNIGKTELELLLEDLIFDGKLNAKIQDDKVIFKHEKKEKEPKVEDKDPEEEESEKKVETHEEEVSIKLNPQDFMVKKRPKKVSAVPKEAKSKLKTSSFAQVRNPETDKKQVKKQTSKEPSPEIKEDIKKAPKTPKQKTSVSKSSPEVGDVDTETVKDRSETQQMDLQENLTDLQIQKAKVSKMILDLDMKELSGEITAEELEEKKERLEQMKEKLEDQIGELKNLISD